MKLCECGCGRLAPIATRNHARWGHVKGQPIRFINKHQGSYPVAAEERFWPKVNKCGPLPSAEAIAAHPEIAGVCCWLWIAGVTATGYGQFNFQGKITKAHRVAWYLKHGCFPKPFGLHKCDNPLCVRVEHLYEGDDADNMKDMCAKGRAAIGEKQGSSKLTKRQVQRVRELKSQGLSYSTLARMFGVCLATLWNVVHRRNWRHVV